MQQLMAGAAPVNETERLWVARVEQALRSYITAVNSIIVEGQRQAQQGYDILGRPIQQSEDHQFEQRVLQLVNAERAKVGLGALAYSQQLDVAAEGHNTTQANTQRMAHDGLGDADPGSRIRATGFTRAWGENVAMGQRSPEQVVAEWMASPGHRKNILDPSFRLMGVSYTQSAGGQTFWAQNFGA